MRFPRELLSSMDIDDAIVELGNIASSPRNRRLEGLRDAIYAASADYEFENVLDHLAEFIAELRRLGRRYEADDVAALKDALYAYWFAARGVRNSGSLPPMTSCSVCGATTKVSPLDDEYAFCDECRVALKRQEAARRAVHRVSWSGRQDHRSELGGGYRSAGQSEKKLNDPSREPFITDMGESPELVADDGSRITLGRYGVWKWNGRKHEVVETGDDLAALQRKHGITDQPISLRFRRNGRCR